MIAIVIFLVVLTFIIYLIPSGPQCPTCNKYLTEHIKFNGFNPEINRTKKIEWTYCYKCKKNFNILVNGVKKDNLDDINK